MEASIKLARIIRGQVPYSWRSSGVSKYYQNFRSCTFTLLLIKTRQHNLQEVSETNKSQLWL